MPLALRGSASVPVGNPTTGFTVSVDAAVQANDLLFLALTSRDSTGAGTLAVTDNDTGGNTWTKIGNSTDHKATLWYKRATSGTASKTVTVANAVGSSSGVLKAFSGGDTGATPYSNVTVESNASGDTTATGWTPSAADSMVCASVHNYTNDNSVTSLATATYGAMTSTEKLSTGGSDCACHFGHDLASGASATGNITWSQATAGASYTISWAVKPALVYAATGTLTAGPAALAASATFTGLVFTGTAALTTGKASLFASGTAAGGLVTATGALTAPRAALAATGQAVYHPVVKVTQAVPTLWSRRYGTFSGKELTPPTWTGAGTLTAGAATLAATAFPEYEHPVGVLTRQGPAVVWQRRYGSFTSKGLTTSVGTAALTTGKATLAASATFTRPVYTGAAALVTGKAALTAVGTTAVPTYHGTAALTAKGPTLAAAAVTTRPAFTGAGALTAGKATLAGTALFATAVYQGVGALVVKAVTLNAAATFRTRHTGTAALAAPPPVMAGIATVANPAGFVIASPAALPANHQWAATPKLMRLEYVGTNTSWTGATTFFPVSGPISYYQAATVTSPTTAHQYVGVHGTLGPNPPGPTGELAMGCSDGSTASIDVLPVGLAVDPEFAGLGETVALDLAGTSSVWVTNDFDDAQLFTVSGGTGATITTTGRTADTAATASLYAGTAVGTLTITDITTGATATLNVGVAFRPGDWPTVRVPARGRTVRSKARRTIKDPRMGAMR